MFLLRLTKGLVKGLLVGALIGWALAAAGFVTMGAAIAYPMAAVVGVVMALVAGKAIWEKGARIEVGMKALAGALLGPGLMWVVRRFVTMGVPFDTSLLPGVASMTAATAGTFAVSALALVAALVGGFYDLDNSDKPADAKAAGAKPAADKKRIAGTPQGRVASAADDAADAEGDAEQQRMRR